MITSFKNNKLTETLNKGGLCSFKFCPVSFVDVMPMAALGEYLAAITFHSGKDWLDGYATYDTLNWEEEPKGVGLYEPVLTGFCPVDEPDNLLLFEEMQSTTFLILSKDRHGRQVLSGQIDHGLFFSFKRSKGTRGNNMHGMTFEFGGRTYERPSYYY